MRPEIEIPTNIKLLPKDPRGYPVPWFVAWIDGKPDFRVVGANKIRDAVQQSRCWVCGRPLGENASCFVIGPMCAVNRVSSEPPSHYECAKFSVQACPFLSEPAVKRNERNLPEHIHDAAGVAIKRNPGVILIWTTTKFEIFKVPNGGVLFDVGQALAVEWYREGRPATRGEVNESIRGGLPVLLEAAMKDGPVALQSLGMELLEVGHLLPAEA